MNYLKTVNGHINGKIVRTISRLIGPQEGLYIPHLVVEEPDLEVTHVITHYLLGVTLNCPSNFYRNDDFWDMKSKQIGFLTIMDNNIANHEFFVHHLHA